MAHCRCSVQEDEEDHGSPADDIEAVECDTKAKGCLEELPECLGADGQGLCPRVLLGEAIAIRVCTRLVGTLRGVKGNRCIHSR